jgi:hypothetical protein
MNILPSQVRFIVISRADTQCLRAADIDQWIQPFGELQIISFQFLLIIFLIGCDEILVLLQCIVASVNENKFRKSSDKNISSNLTS